jgi:peptidoglycan/LPS O-acetylase OafA/YrhL
LSATANSPAKIQPRGRAASSYIPGLDGVRAIAFLMVFCAHATPGRLSRFIPATLGVTIFFFLSGFLITTLLRKEITRTGAISLRDFYIRRTLRIFAPLYLIYALSVPFTHYVLHTFAGNLRGAVSVLLYFYNYGIVMNLNTLPPQGMDVVWSLCVEEHFYILFPLLYLTMTRRKISIERQTRFLLGLCAIELAWRFVLCVVFRKAGGWTYFATDARFDSILWGCILALRNNPLYADRSILPRGREKLVFAAAVFLLGCTLLPPSLLYRETLRYTLQAVSLYVIFSFVIANIQHWSVRWLEWQPLRYVGWVSYVLYLCHRPIVDLMEQYFPGKLWISAPLAFVGSLAFATLMRYTLELPLQKLRARFRRVPELDPTAADGHGLVS